MVEMPTTHVHRGGHRRLHRRLHRVLAGAVGTGLLCSAAVVAGHAGAAETAAPLTTGTHNDTAFSYTGTWKTTTGSALYQRDDHRSATAGSTYRFDFTGVQARILATVAPGMGIMTVRVDDAAATPVDLYAATRRSQAAVYTTPLLDDGVHRVEVTVTGTKNAAAKGRTVNADRVDVVAPPSGSPDPPPGSTGAFHAFGDVTLDTEFVASGAGRNIDSIAFWEGPVPEDMLMFVTSKSLSLVEVWRHPFDSAAAEAPALVHPCLQATTSSATNGVVVDQQQHLLYVASNYSTHVCVFSLPALEHVRTITSGVGYGREPNLALLRLPDGTRRLYVSRDDRVFVHDPASGALLSTFFPAKGLETMWGDSFAQVLYIPDENGRTGVYAYRPDGTPYVRGGTDVFGSTVFGADAEGITQYTCPADGSGDDGAGLIIVSDQITDAAAGNEFEVFDRQTWTHLGTLRLRLPDGKGLVSNTDGVASTQQSSARYPGGVLTAVHDDTSVVGVGWDRVLEAVSASTGKPFGCTG